MFSDKRKAPDRYCRYCGQPLPRKARFCTQCGKAVADPNAVSPPQKAMNAELPGTQTKPPAAALKKSFIVIACVAVVVIVAAMIAGRAYIRNRDYHTYLDTGLHFLSEGNYEEAVLAFNAAIEIDPKSAEAYIGLGDAHTGMERYSRAADEYEQAIKISDQYVDAYSGLANAYLELGDVESAVRILNEGADAIENEELKAWARMIRELNGGSSSLNGAVSEYLVGGGTALLPGARVRLYVPLKDMPRLIQATVTDQNGAFSLPNLAAGTYILHVDAAEHIGVESIEILDEGESAYTELFLMIPETDTVRNHEAGSFYACVTNALNGNALPDIKVVMRPGWNNRDGDIIAEAVSDGDGGFSVEGLDYGYYTVEANASNYLTAYCNVAVLPEEFPTEWEIPVSPVLSAGETRIVLTWNQEPRDLDSHLTGPGFHVYFTDKNGFDTNGNHRVNLDLDDTDGYGPETVTIYSGVDGTYTYSVHDFSNKNVMGSTALSMSGATVRVYQEAGLVAEYHVPTSSVGLTWTVFRLHEDGTIETVNTMEDSNSILYR